MGISEKIMNFLQIAKGCKFARECDWIGKILKTFEIWGFFSIDKWFFQKKLDVFKNV